MAKGTLPKIEDTLYLWKLTLIAEAKSGIYIVRFEDSPEHSEISKINVPITTVQKR